MADTAEVDTLQKELGTNSTVTDSSTATDNSSTAITHSTTTVITLFLYLSIYL